MIHRFIQAVSFALVMTACGDASSQPPFPGGGTDGQLPVGPITYSVGGQVLDSRGQGVPGVKIVVDHTVYYNAAITGTTDAQGYYKLTVSDGSWRVYAQKNLTYNNRTYLVNYHPDNLDSFAGHKGAVRNFQFKLTGPKPAPMVGTYGGTVLVSGVPGGDFYDTPNVKVKMTPVGPLIDGSQGEVITRQPGAARTDTYGQIVDLPIGRYAYTAVYAPEGATPIAMRVRLEGQATSEQSVTADFDPQDHNRVRLEVELP